MATSNQVLTALRDELVAAGLVRKPATVGNLPPMHVEPRRGPLAPGEGEAPETDGDLVVTIRLSSEVAGLPPLRRIYVVDFVYRSKASSGLLKGRALDEAIRQRLVDGSGYGVGIKLAAGQGSQLWALQVSTFGGLGPVSDVEDVHTDVSKLAVETSS